MLTKYQGRHSKGDETYKSIMMDMSDHGVGPRGVDVACVRGHRSVQIPLRLALEEILKINKYKTIHCSFCRGSERG
jgi:hypothetical protein